MIWKLNKNKGLVKFVLKVVNYWMILAPPASENTDQEKLKEIPLLHFIS